MRYYISLMDSGCGVLADYWMDVLDADVPNNPDDELEIKELNLKWVMESVLNMRDKWLRGTCQISISLEGEGRDGEFPHNG